MRHQIPRQELYDRVWSEPVKTVASKLGVSDVALAKACRRAEIPVPELGYWARLRAGKEVSRRPLPPRGLGMADTVEIGKGLSETPQEAAARLLNEPIEPPPPYPEEMSHIAERVAKMVADVKVPRTLDKPHPVIAHLLGEDERRRQVGRILNEALFDSPFERRRLRILNALFLGLQRCGCRPWVRDKQAREIGVEVGQTNVTFSLDAIKGRPHTGRAVSPSTGDAARHERMRLTVSPLWRIKTTERSWDETEGQPFEAQLSTIMTGLIVAGEEHYRAGAQALYEWRLERKAELQAEARRRKEEQERKERERLAQLERERLERLFAAASDWRRANDLRAFVAAVRDAHVGVDETVDVEALERWAADALEAVLDSAGRFRNLKSTGPQGPWGLESIALRHSNQALASQGVVMPEITRRRTGEFVRILPT
jgi:hypothetical protein